MNDFDEFDQMDEIDDNEDEQSDNSGNKDNSNMIKYIIIGVIVVLVLLILLGVYSSAKKNKNNGNDGPINTITDQDSITFELVGDKKITVILGQQFSDPGFVASSKKNGNLSSFVEVDGTVDVNKVGKYEIVYTLVYDGSTKQLMRTVEVVEDGDSSGENNNGNSDGDDGNNNGSGTVDDPNSTVSISLNGSSTVYIFKGVNYNDAGARATNKNGADISNRISTSGGVNTGSVGSYTITYSVSNSSGQVKSVSRQVHVLDMNATITPNNKNYTNQDVDLNINVQADRFSYIVLPNGQKVSQSNYTFKVSSNGSYSFQVYNDVGLAKKYTYNVKNIDKEKPTGSCTVSHGSNGSVITISAKDNIGIALYGYNDKKYNTNKLTFNGFFQQGLTINVSFYDFAGNYGTASCVAPAR